MDFLKGSLLGRRKHGRQRGRSQRKCLHDSLGHRVPAPHSLPKLCTPSSCLCLSPPPTPRTSLTSPSSPAVPDPAHPAHPTPQAAAETGTAVTPARSVASAHAGASSHGPGPSPPGHPHPPRPPVEEGQGLPRDRERPAGESAWWVLLVVFMRRCRAEQDSRRTQLV